MKKTNNTKKTSEKGISHYAQAREELRQWLIKWTSGCDIQNAENGDEYPCGTCVIQLFKDIGLNSKDKSYKEHNKPVDRLNEVWRAILQIRDAKI